MKEPLLLKRFLVWRVKHITNRQFFLLLSVVVGLLAGLSAVILKNVVHFIRWLLTYEFSKEYQNYLYLAYPAIGILIVILFIKYFLKQTVRDGIPNVLYAISKNNSIISRHNMFSSIVTSSITVGFGGSVGLEGPAVVTGAAIGSNTGRLFHLSYKQITLLLGCAGAGALAAIFKAPIAAIVFALEVLMLDLTMSSLIPLLIATVTATLTSYLFLGQDVIYPFKITEGFIISNIHLYILLGVFSGLLSVYFTRTYMSVTNFFGKINNWIKRLLIGGLSLGVLIFFLPSLYGEGYETVNSCLHGNYSYLFNNSLFYDYRNSIIAIILSFFAILVFKVIATSLTIGSGGIGGMFAPALFMGANAGLLFATVYNQFGFKQISESKFALVGMAGLIAGVLHAPLTSIFLIAEITGGYDLIIPLMITATISYVTIKYFEPNSVYTMLLAKRKQLITHDKDKAVLTLMKIDNLIETNFKTIHADATLGDLVRIVAESKRNIFPVIDNENNLQGIITMDYIRNIMFRTEMYNNTFVRDLMFLPAEDFISPNDSMEDIAQKFHTSSNYNLPVVKDGKYVGFVSRANVFSSYRKMLKDFSED